MNPLVSIITANYNAQKFITTCIDSVINQTYTNWELLVVDDCSNDNSLNIIKEFIKKEPRIKLIKLDSNVGAAKARNSAIKIAKGAFIAFLDSDDSWLSNKLELQIAFMLKRDIAFSFSSYYSYNEQKKDRKTINSLPIITYKKLLSKNYIGCLTAVYSVEKLGKIYMPNILKRQDWALWLKITKNGNPAYGIKEPLANYTRRESSLSSNKLDLLKYNWQVYRDIEGLTLLQSLYYFTFLVLKKIF